MLPLLNVEMRTCISRRQERRRLRSVRLGRAHVHRSSHRDLYTGFGDVVDRQGQDISSCRVPGQKKYLMPILVGNYQ